MASEEALEEAGLTPSERYLGRLCRNSFLSLWSYSNPYNDRGIEKNKNRGQELCDLLVIFEKNIIIFSDKSCAVGNCGNIQVDWNRWYKRAVSKSADQIFGAERWLAEFPHRIFLDKECRKPFPLDIPSPDDWRVHRIVVALGAEQACAKYFGGGSRGSLMLVPMITGDQHYTAKVPAGPFRIGSPRPEKGFVHVFDDVTLDLVMSEVNTITDFVRYLDCKEEFFGSGRLFVAHGEEEALAFYKSNLSDKNLPSFELPPEAKKDPSISITLAEGLWDEYVASEAYRDEQEILRASYFFDGLIESISTHVLSDSLAYGRDRTIKDHERNIRFMASEPRRQRAMFAHAMLQKLETTPPNVRTSIMVPSDRPNIFFVFLLAPKNSGETQHRYRLRRQLLLEAYAWVVKLLKPTAEFVYGIATEPGIGRRRSEDLMSFDFRSWADEDYETASKIQKEMDILTDYDERKVLGDIPNTKRPELAKGNRATRRKVRAEARRLKS